MVLSYYHGYRGTQRVAILGLRAFEFPDEAVTKSFDCFWWLLLSPIGSSGFTAKQDPVGRNQLTWDGLVPVGICNWDHLAGDMRGGRGGEKERQKEKRGGKQRERWCPV